MSDRSAIEWTDASWNPIRALAGRPDGTVRYGWHCEHVSEGCRNCYAETINRRLGTKLDYKPGYLRAVPGGEPKVEVFLDEKALLQPLKWRKPRKIFVCSMTDLFADFVSEAMIDAVFAIMALCPQHVFQVLTKRPERMRRYFDRKPEIMWSFIDNFVDDWTNGLYGDVRLPIIGDDPVLAALYAHGASWGGERPWPLRNIWLGTSVEDQAAADERIPHLLATPAAVRWLSCEPLLGPVEWPDDARRQAAKLSGRGRTLFAGVDWVVVGGESGPAARPMHPDWARVLRDQCEAAGIPFLFKQWGEWAPGAAVIGKIGRFRAADLGRNGWMRFDHFQSGDEAGPPPDVVMFGKKHAGRLLDGVQHDAFPALPAPGSLCSGTPT